MNKPKIGILHYAAPPIIGGVEFTIGAHARLFADHGYAVKIIAGRGESFDARVAMHIHPALDSHDPNVVAINHSLARGIVPEEFSTLESRISNVLTDAFADVDVLIAHNVLTLNINLALTKALYEIARAKRLHLIAWCHDLAWLDPVYVNNLHAGMPWDLLRVKWDEVKYVVVSQARQKETARLLQMDEKEIAIVPPGIDANEFLGVSETARRWSREFALFDAAPLLLLPTRVTRRKNIELAIEITAALVAQRLAPKLLVMGPLGAHNPANRAYLDELLALRRARGLDDAVIFLNEYGAVDDATRRDLYLLADALLFTSEREGFGIPILEAGLTRLPIFCADIEPFRESAQDDAIYFALAQAPDTIARAIADVLAHDARYRMKRRVVKNYRWEEIFVRQIEPLLKSN